MIRNYLKIAFRNLWKNKTASFINIFGLTIGLCSCLLIGLYIRHELNYDAFQHNGDLIDEKAFMYADPSFFSIFSFKLLQGDAVNVLNAPNRVVLTASTAK